MYMPCVPNPRDGNIKWIGNNPEAVGYENRVVPNITQGCSVPCAYGVGSSVAGDRVDRVQVRGDNHIVAGPCRPQTTISRSRQGQCNPGRVAVAVAVAVVGRLAVRVAKKLNTKIGSARPPVLAATALAPDVFLTGASVHVTNIARKKPFVARFGPVGAGTCVGIAAV